MGWKSTQNTKFGQKLVYKKLDPPKPKNKETERANIRNCLHRKQKIGKISSNLTQKNSKNCQDKETFKKV